MVRPSVDKEVAEMIVYIGMCRLLETVMEVRKGIVLSISLARRVKRTR